MATDSTTSTPKGVQALIDRMNARRSSDRRANVQLAQAILKKQLTTADKLERPAPPTTPT